MTKPYRIASVVFSFASVAIFSSVPLLAAENRPEVIAVRLALPGSQSGKGKTFYELQIPKNHFQSKNNLREAQSIKGADGFFLWFLYGTNEGISGKAVDQYLNKWTPNQGIKLSIEASKSDTSMDKGKRYLDSRLNAPSYSPVKLAPNPAKKLGQGITAYQFVNDKTGRNPFSASFVQSDGTIVFLDGHFGTVCTAYKTWKKMLDVQYSFFCDPFEKELVRLDDAVNRLLDSFEPRKL